MIDHVVSTPLTLKEQHEALLTQIDLLRLRISGGLDSKRKADYGQFFTPSPIAKFMSAMFAVDTPSIKILDAGAGVGSLFAATVLDLASRRHRPTEIHITAYEIDAQFMPALHETLHICQRFGEQSGVIVTGEIINADFIESAVQMLNGNLFAAYPLKQFDCVILNPPYQKIQTRSHYRNLLRQIGVETSNLYAGFTLAAMGLLKPSGQLIAITPRSFCNGAYFRSFRSSLLDSMTIKKLHVFESRQTTFVDDDVLQENIIMHAIREEKRGSSAKIEVSLRRRDGDVIVRTAAYDQVIHPYDPEKFIHIVPEAPSLTYEQALTQLHSSLANLGISVSTGRVVDFRAQQFLRLQAEVNTVPLIYPLHLQNGMVEWPKLNTKKHNALVASSATHMLLVPNENYVLVKRFSSKEQSRRIIAAVFDGSKFTSSLVGFENHLNYFHRNGHGLGLQLARGLAAFLNSTWLDKYFRQFSGHTQVNATDLRNIAYPTIAQLESLGAHIDNYAFSQQDELDQIVERELFCMTDEQDKDAAYITRRVSEAQEILKALGLPHGQYNERSARVLLALLGLRPNTSWSEATNPQLGITPIIAFIKAHYDFPYDPNSREPVRRQTIHQFVQVALVVANPDHPGRAVNSPHYVYQIESSALQLLRTYGTTGWDENLRSYLASAATLAKRHAQARELTRLPVKTPSGKSFTLSPGGQNDLIKAVIEVFGALFTPGGDLLYVGDADKKKALLEEDVFAALGIHLQEHGSKMPDVIIHYAEKQWLVLIEAVAHHGPVDAKRRNELRDLFGSATSGLVFVTAFANREAMKRYLPDIAWETEVWVADAPTHLIHFNGARFGGPYDTDNPPED